MGDLLPPTDFELPVDEDRELIPDAADNEPEILIATPDQPAGSTSATATVAEAALSQRGSEPAGSDPASNAETVTGAILINSVDQPNSIAVNGTLITGASQTITTPFGVLTITSIESDSIGYSYTLSDNATVPEASDVVTIVVTDRDGDTATATLTLSIADDVPTARPDTENVAPNDYLAQTGNVLTGAGTASGAAGADTQGADGASVTGIRAASVTDFSAVGAAIQGQYGRLTINADGSYSYTRNAGTPGGVTDVFTYRLTDGDGDVATATLTFAIGDSGVGVIVPSAGDDGTLVDEAGLPERDNGDPGSRAGDDSNITFGVVGFEAPDGPATITINGVVITDEGQAIELANGTLYIIGITPNGFEYAYVLTDNSVGTATETISVTVTDRDGDSVTSSFVIDIADDAPSAVADTDSIAAGTYGPATGNVITDAEGDGGEDIPGADGALVVAVSSTAGSVAAGQPIVGLYGTLTVNADGSYSYIRAPGTPGGVADVFTYTLRDGDGDEVSANLTINIRDGGITLTVPSGADDGQIVAEAGLENGSDPESGSATTEGSLAFTAVDGPAKIFIGGVEVTAVGQEITGNNGTLTITAIGAGTITYSYTLTSPASWDEAQEVFGVKVVDADGDAANGNLVIDIVDDVPIARPDPALSIAEDEPAFSGELLANDSLGADGAVLESVVIGGVNVVIAASGTTTHSNALGTYSFDASGAWSFDPVPGSRPDTVDAGFTYTIVDGDGDRSTAAQAIALLDGRNPQAGAPLALALDDQNLENGSDPTSDPLPTTSGTMAFTAGSDPIASIAFGSLAGLDGGLTWVFDSPTTVIGYYTDIPIVQLDLTVTGTTARVTAMLYTNYPFHPDISTDDIVDLGSMEIVATDSDGDVAVGSVAVSISDDVPTIAPLVVPTGLLTVDETNLAHDATANFAGLFAMTTGADQPGSVSYSFTVIPVSGLVDVATGASILLSASGNVVEGYLAGSPSTLAFTLTVGANGIATLNQLRPVRHADGSNPDDPVTLDSFRITLTATITDSEGDSASASINIGKALTFRDDGPSIDVATAGPAGVVLTTQDADTRGAAFDTASASFAAAFTTPLVEYGADGAPVGANVSWQYALVLTSAATGLSSNGVAITLSLVGGEIVGNAGATPVFSVSVDAATGIVTLKQFAEIDHPLPGASSDYASQLLELPAGLIALQGSATITDRDGDSISDSAAMDLGGAIRFADDGPSIAAGGTGGELIVDETNFAVDASADLSTLFTASLDHGADGAGTVTYQLGLTAAATGLVDSLSGEAVTLSIVGGAIYGRTSAHEVFRISVDGAGVVTFNQSRAVLHTPDSGPDQTIRLTGANLITLTATAIDGDSDSAQATVDITDRFVIHDDAPLAVTDEDNLARDGEIFADGNVLTGVGSIDTNTMDGAADSAGSDGGLRVVGIASGATAGTVGTSFAGEYGSIILLANGSYRYDLDIADPAVVALGGTETLVEIFRYTVADADGDLSEAEIRITITGANDFPIARADTNWVLDGAMGTDPAASGNVLQDVPHPGAPSGSFADVADIDPDLEVLTVTSPGTYVGAYGTLVIAANGTYTYTLNEDSPLVNAVDSGATLSESFAYTISDGALSVSSSLTITVFGTNDAPTVGTSIARISEEGLAGANPDSLPNATLDTTNASSFSGVLAIADLDAGETLTATLGDPGNVLSVGGVAVTWSGVGTGTLVGSVGANEVIRITLAPSGAYSVTLSHSVDHANLTLEDLREFTVPVSVSDGTVTTTKADAIHVVIEDDSPTATGETGTSSQPAQNVNTLFILDFSASIDDGELDVMLSAVKDALTLLDNSVMGSVDVKFVIFSTSSFASPSFTSAAAANAYLDSLNPSEGGERPASSSIGETTNYTSAIQTALANFSTVSGASNQVFFLSDGNPNSQVQTVFVPPTPPVVVNSLLNATAAAWNSFVDNNNVNVTAIGVDNNPIEPLNIQRLADVDLNAAPDNVPILVADFDDLVETLLEIVVPVAVGGDLDANDSYGADGGRILSITVGAVEYVWDGASTISLSGGGTIAGSSINAITPQGGTLTLNFATGQYSYQPPTPITVTATEIFNYVIVDGDGDRATASLSVTITAAAPPVVLDLDGDGVEFVSSAAGARFDYDGDGTAELTAWAGADDGLLVLDRNGDGKITDRAELVFAKGVLTDLQGLAADHDSNGDGQLDAADSEFARFGVWQDADSDGVTDPGEYRTLAEAGIVRIGLVSDGKSYLAANGEVTVKGEALYIRADGTSGKLADATFATNFANDVQRSLVAGANTMSAAMFAAGLVAALPVAAADEDKTDGLEARELDLAPYAEPATPAGPTVADGPESELWLGNYLAPQRLHDEPNAQSELYRFGDVDEAPAAIDLPVESVGQRPAVQSVEQDAGFEAPAEVPVFAFGGGADQAMGALMISAPGPAAPEADLGRMVAEALEGREIDLDALAVVRTADPVLPMLDLAAFDAIAGANHLFVADFQHVQLTVQFEQMAAAGQA
ncbi:MAG: hypothetical protein IPM41_03890 [Sphingomonadales bacterium]|nr:hypothetical protein [Sphingomonadales bacterium]